MADVLPNGIGGTTGDSLVSAKPLIQSSRVWYVDSQTGNASNTGKDRTSALATIAGAITAIGAADDHVIVCLSGHTEAVAAVMTLAQRVTILGEGSSSGTPTVKLTIDHSTANVFTITAARCQIRNIHFRPRGQAASPSAASGSYISSSVASCVVKGCKFDFDQYSDGPGVSLGSGANDWKFVNCTFTSTETATGATLKPDSAFRSSAALTGLILDGCTFDGGTVGFQTSGSNAWAFDGSAAAITAIWCEGLSLLRGADMKLHASSVGYVNPQTTSGNARVEW